jgi:hypothetical protein
MINHINLPDAGGQVYCCLRNRVISYDLSHQNNYCSNCKMFNGTAAGCGVECLWDDNRVSNGSHVFVTDPVREWACNQEKRVQALIAEWVPVEVETEPELFGDSFGDRGEAAV